MDLAQYVLFAGRGVLTAHRSVHLLWVLACWRCQAHRKWIRLMSDVSKNNPTAEAAIPKISIRLCSYCL